TQGALLVGVLLRALHGEPGRAPQRTLDLVGDGGGRSAGLEQDGVGARVLTAPRAGIVGGAHQDRPRRPADVRGEGRHAEPLGLGARQCEARADAQVVFFGKRLGEDEPAAAAHTLGGLARVACKKLVGRQQRCGLAGWGHHEHATLAVVEQAAAIETDCPHALELLQLRTIVRHERRGLEQVVGAGWGDPQVGVGVAVAGRVVQAREQVSVRSADRDAAEDGNRAGGRDGDSARAALSSIVATCGIGLTIREATRLTSVSVVLSTIGNSSSSAATSRTMPGIAASGAASSKAVAAPRQARPAKERRLPLEGRVPVRSRGAIAASGSRARMSRSGLSTATIAASIPPPAAIATLCQVTTRWEPSANASERKAGF